MIAMAITIMIAMSVTNRAPPPPVRGTPTKGHPAVRHTEGESPSGIGIPMHAVAVGNRTGIIIGSIPGPVVITRTIINTTPVRV
jgi:hypothetical protein